MSLAAELESNFDRFAARFESELASVRTTLSSQREIFLRSYTRIASLNAWREQLLKSQISKGSLAFFLEAQNDALTSHVLARFGAWRAANQMLRSFIENSLECVFFKDHPIELRQWETGVFKLSFAEAITYLKSHPDIKPFYQMSGLTVLQREYATLCKAVHGAASFRMTHLSIGTKLWSADIPDLGRWRTREKASLEHVNCLYVTLFREQLQGARLPGLRQILGLAIAPSKHTEIKKKFSVVLG